MNTHRRHRFHAVLRFGIPVGLTACWVGGCHKPADLTNEATVRQSLNLLMPRSVHIVEPFTTWADLDGKPGLDGITVCVQPINPLGDPIQTAGTMLVELYAFKPASGDPKGDRLDLWEIPLLTEADQESRWNRATQMYEFHLTLSADRLPALPGDQVVILVTHHSPLGEHHMDEYILAVPLARGRLAGQ